MQTNVKTWLETTGMKVAEDRFLVPPDFPYIVFLSEDSIYGTDYKNCINNRSITIEMYSETINNEAEQKIESLLNEKSIQYTKSRTWIGTESFFQTVYDFDLLEKF